MHLPEPKRVNFNDLFSSRLTVPPFQREFAWDKKFVKKYVEEIIEGVFGEDGDNNYFVGAMIGVSKPDNTYEIIDGQQRTVTTFLMICVLRDLMRLESKGTTRAMDNVLSLSELNDDGENEVVRLKLQYSDAQDVIDSIVLRGNIPECYSNSSKKIAEAYKIIEGCLVNYFDSSSIKLATFWNRLMDSVHLIKVDTTNRDSALKIYETINARGVSLTPLDLIKNLIFMRADSEIYDKLSEKWVNFVRILEKNDKKPDHFLRHYVTSQVYINSGVVNKNVYEWFGEKGDVLPFYSEPEKFLDSLIQYATFYVGLLDGNNPDGSENIYLKNIKYFGGSIRRHLPLLLSVVGLNKSDFTLVCKNVEEILFIFLVNRTHRGYVSNSFINWADVFRKKLSEGVCVVDIIDNTIVKEKLKLRDEFKSRMEILREGSEGVGKRPVKYILAKIVQYVEGDCVNSVMPYTSNKYHREHIFPINPDISTPDISDDAKNSLGNFTLLESDINTSIKNKSFEKKKELYMRSGLRFNLYLYKDDPRACFIGKFTSYNRRIEDMMCFGNEDVWGIEQINNRQHDLVNTSLKVWGL